MGSEYKIIHKKEIFVTRIELWVIFLLFFSKYYLNIFTTVIVFIFLFCYERTQRANKNMNWWSLKVYILWHMFVASPAAVSNAFPLCPSPLHKVENAMLDFPAPFAASVCHVTHSWPMKSKRNPARLLLWKVSSLIKKRDP